MLTFERANPTTFPPRSRDLILSLFGGLGLLVLVSLGEWTSLLQPLRLILGVAYVLYVPGYCLTAALFPRRDDLDGIERVGLSLGLSVAWIPLLALLLDRLPWGLRLWPILLGQLFSVLLFAAVASWRRARLPAGEAHAPQLDWRPRPWWRMLSRYEKRIYKLCAGALLLAGLSAAWIFLVPSPAEFMTEFYVLGKEGLAEDYPRQATVGESLSVTMGINNRERGERVYRAEAWAQDIWVSERRALVGEAGPFRLQVGETYEGPFTWEMPWPGQDQQVEFLLFVGDDLEVYRRLRLWLDVDEF